MANPSGGILLRHIRKLLAVPSARELPDQQLLERFIHRHDEVAFETLIQRHGPLVLGLCRRVLHHEHDAEDAFQATFLVLAQKAGSIRKLGSVSSWLYGVANRIAAKARMNAAKRRSHENRAESLPTGEPAEDVNWRELRSVLDEELQRLPEKYRAPLVLCYLEGKTQDEAARELDWTAGSVKGRLERGRDALRVRLSRRGVTLSVALLTTMLTRKATVQAALLDTTVRTAMLNGHAYGGRAGRVRDDFCTGRPTRSRSDASDADDQGKSGGGYLTGGEHSHSGHGNNGTPAASGGTTARRAEGICQDRGRTGASKIERDAHGPIRRSVAARRDRSARDDPFSA